MTDTNSGLVVALPSEGQGGLEAPLSEHFGHCSNFTLVTLGTDGPSKVETVPGVPHEHNGCMAVVNYLAEHKAKALVAYGMGRRPLMGLAEVGIAVHHCNQAVQNVGDALQAFLDGKLPCFDASMTCGGHDH